MLSSENLIIERVVWQGNHLHSNKWKILLENLTSNQLILCIIIFFSLND